MESLGSHATMIRLTIQIHHVGIGGILKRAADFSRLVNTSQNFIISPGWLQYIL